MKYSPTSLLFHPLLIFSQCHCLLVNYVNGYQIINVLKEYDCHEIRETVD